MTSPLAIKWTKWHFIGNIDSFEQMEQTWAEFVSSFSEHVRVSDKMKAPGFGPYYLTPTHEPCRAHKDGKVRVKAHRCDECVKEMTLAVFDVDTGTQEDIERCEAKLEKANLSRLWYSSFSYSPEQERPSFRLVLPFSTPLDPREWPSVRASLIYQYGIPCLVSACKGKSHFYFIPSASMSNTQTISFSTSGVFLSHATLPKVLEQKGTKRLVALDKWNPPAEPDPSTPIDMEGMREVITRRRNHFSRGKVENKYKSLLLTRLLNGEPLEQHGKRNDAMTLICGIVAYALFDKPVSWLLALIRPSLSRMISEGSSLTEAEVERLLLTAMRKKAEAEAANKQLHAGVAEVLNSVRLLIPEKNVGKV
jgi:hypothetical protein